MTSLTVVVPGTPPRALSPNGRAHWGTVAKLTRRARADAATATRAAVLAAMAAGTMLLDLVFDAGGPIWVDALVRWEPRRNMGADDDNLWASLKAWRDGAADGLGVDDRRFALGTLREERDPAGRGEVVLVLTAAWDACPAVILSGYADPSSSPRPWRSAAPCATPIAASGGLDGPDGRTAGGGRA